MIEFAEHLKAVHRELAKEDGQVVGVRLTRTYDATAEDVWDAVTDPARLRRWFLPVSGDLREGGDFQLEGNAGGDILACEPPRRLRVTFGGETSIVEVRLVPEDGGGRTTLELEHTVPPEMAAGGAGALYVGPGWDGGLLALGLHVGGEVGEDHDPVAAADSPATQRFTLSSIGLWTAVVEEAGSSSAEDLAAAVDVAEAQFAPDVDRAGGAP
ncbi:SRPBCC family protein [Saccharothrix longispora]|uniref:SRPBCC family protein n=1 Tax=Saccharothrix longispora TaxID=33920 RepID=UPI0028FD93D4|nr:SRPBCC family protein [Saccharothrix longispora]MBY8847321.1 SRPBCC family protein [Saccharothrix sp. MB29]MDU0289201.1 SRPBCC family protein [Saccharothrix longispora]